jgi:hypothetical protein
VRSSDWTEWLLEVWGSVGERQIELGSTNALTDWEKLISILGYSEYCVSNAGDFANMEVINPDFRRDAVSIADQLNLPMTRKMFLQSEQMLAESFDASLDDVCLEIAKFVNALPYSGSVGAVSKLWAEKCSLKS